MRNTTKLRLAALLLGATAAATLGAGLAPAGTVDGRTTATAAGGATPRGKAGRVDPRADGFEITLGEWAVIAEARVIRAGRVTIVVRNSGRFRHGLEIKLDRGDKSGTNDAAESIELAPGRSTTMTLDLAPGIYEIECFVDDHDDRGMYGFLEVREDAPLVVARPAGGRSAVRIAGFAFKPATLKTTVGSVVTWRNADSAPHTATAKSFSSPELRQGGTYRRRFNRAGTYAYVCAVHPAMRGKVVVQGRAG